MRLTGHTYNKLLPPHTHRCTGLFQCYVSLRLRLNRLQSSMSISLHTHKDKISRKTKAVQSIGMQLSNISTSLFLTASLLLATVLAQNSTNTTNPSCSTSTEIETKVNSTDQYDFTSNSSYTTNDPWYVSVVVGPDRLSPEDFAASKETYVLQNASDDARCASTSFATPMQR